MADSKEEATHHLKVLMFLLESLGFMVNPQNMLLSGVRTLNSNSLKQICREATELIQKESVSALCLSQFIGKLNAASHAILVAPLFFRALQGDLQKGLAHGGQDYNHLLTLSLQAKEELHWWQTHLTHWNGRSTLRRPVQATIQSHAPLAGWGAVCNGVRTGGGSWTPREQEMYINCLELLATDLAMKSFLKSHKDVTVLLQLDNSTAVTTWGAQYPQSSPSWPDHSQERDMMLSAQHIPRVLNTMADHESRVERDRSDWMLSPAVFPRIEPNSGPPRGRPVRLPIDSATSTVLQLETRPTGRSNR